MNLRLWQVDAFTRRPLAGNPAAVVPLEAWLPDTLMQAIAAENNLSETAFLVPLTGDASDRRYVRLVPAAGVPVVLALHAAPIAFAVAIFFAS